jgi:hypothetical protein
VYITTVDKQALYCVGTVEGSVFLFTFDQRSASLLSCIHPPELSAGSPVAAVMHCGKSLFVSDTKGYLRMYRGKNWRLQRCVPVEDVSPFFAPDKPAETEHVDMLRGFVSSTSALVITAMSSYFSGLVLVCGDSYGHVFFMDATNIADLPVLCSWVAHTSPVRHIVVEKEKVVTTDDSSLMRMWSTDGEHLGTFGILTNTTSEKPLPSEMPPPAWLESQRELTRSGSRSLTSFAQLSSSARPSWSNTRDLSDISPLRMDNSISLDSRKENGSTREPRMARARLLDDSCEGSTSKESSFAAFMVGPLENVDQPKRDFFDDTPEESSRSRSREENVDEDGPAPRLPFRSPTTPDLLSDTTGEFSDTQRFIASSTPEPPVLWRANHVTAEDDKLRGKMKGRALHCVMETLGQPRPRHVKSPQDESEEKTRRCISTVESLNRITHAYRQGHPIYTVQALRSGVVIRAPRSHSSLN